MLIRATADPTSGAPAPWTGILPASTRAAAEGVAHDVLARCSDPERMRSALIAARGQTDYPRTVYWEPYGLAQGDAGLALMAGYAATAFSEDGWDVTAHERLATAVRGAEQAPWLPPGLFGGVGGLLLTVTALSRDGARYNRLLASLDRTVAAAARDLAKRVEELPPGCSVGEFDLISGLAGVGAALLARHDGAEAHDALAAVLTALVTLVDDTGGAMPRWFTPPELMGDDATARIYPEGNLNCGLAHGIPGPLALMALARRNGIDVQGMQDAIAHIAAWLVAHRVDDAWGVNWPTAVTLDSGLPEGPSRAAWCYGAPGVARALWLAGESLGDDALRATALEGMKAVYCRPVAERKIDSPTFCHGVAGLLQVTLRFAHDTGHPVFREAAHELTEQLLGAYDGSRLLGYSTLEPGGNPVDQPGLLDGAPGVALVLLAAATDAAPVWDRAFLLS
jgi:lantibiotic biosynthesis protein